MNELREPSTEAGRSLLPQPGAQELHRRSAMGRRVKLATGILAIEEEAARIDVDRLTLVLAAVFARFIPGRRDPDYDRRIDHEWAAAIVAEYERAP